MIRAPGHRKVSEASRAGVTLLFGVGSLVLVNLIASRVVARVDLTEDRRFTLSPESRQLVRSLPDAVTVKAYISKGLPPELASSSRHLRELLAEYQTASGGKLRLEVTDPDGDKKAEDDAEACHVGRMAIQIRRTNQAEVGRYHLGLCLWYGGKSRPLAPIGPATQVEYQVSALIKRMSQKQRRVAFTTSHGEQDLATSYSFMKRALDEEFQVVTLDPSVNDLGDDVDLLVVAGPRRPFDDRARRQIDGFVMKGRPALFLIDGMAPSEPPDDRPAAQRTAQPVDAGLDPLLASYGFRIGRDLVLDRVNVPGPVGSGERQLITNFPAFLGIKPDPDRDRDLSVLAGITMMVFPFASSVELVGPLARGAPAGAHLWRLARSSPGSWRQTGASVISAAAAPDEAATRDQASFALGYAYQGMLASAYPEALAGPRGRPAVSQKPVRLVVIGDSDFASDPYARLMRDLPIYAGGPQMLLNAVSWMLEDDALTPLRANVIKARPLEVGSDDRAAVIKWGNIFGVPLVFCAAGVLRWRVRATLRRRQRLG